MVEELELHLNAQRMKYMIMACVIPLVHQDGVKTDHCVGLIVLLDITNVDHYALNEKNVQVQLLIFAKTVGNLAIMAATYDVIGSVVNTVKYAKEHMYPICPDQ